MKYFSYDPYDGFEFHRTAAAAKIRAQRAHDNNKDEAADQGWPEESDDVCWGEVHERVTLTKEIPRPLDAHINDGQDAEGNDWDNDFVSIQEKELKKVEGD